MQVQERSRNDDTGEVELKVIPVHGDTVYAEIGGEATTASLKVENGLFTSHEMEVSFLAVDSTGTHPQGPAQTWKNRVTLKYRLFSGPASQRMLELKAAPDNAGRTELRYTTDGSDPKLNGGTYDGPLEIAKGTQVVLAYAGHAPAFNPIRSRFPSFGTPRRLRLPSIRTNRSSGSGGTNAASRWSRMISSIGSSGTRPA